MKLYGIIYVAINLINGKMYVGQTVNFKKRIREHKREMLIFDDHFHRALKKYGWSNFHFSTLDTCYGSADDLNILEIFYIEKLVTYYHGYNSTHGGGGIHGHKHTEATRQKISQKAKGRKKSKAHCENLSKAHLGLKRPPRTEEHKKNIAKAKMGDKNPMFGKTGVECPNFGRTRTREQRIKYAIANGGKPFLCHQNQKIYILINEAASELGVNASAIGACLKGRSKTAKGYTFQYADLSRLEQIPA